jgi:hypothetical protein
LPQQTLKSELRLSLIRRVGVAIVIVNHITKMPTLLHEVLPSYTSMPVSMYSFLVFMVFSWFKVSLNLPVIGAR